MKEAAPGVLAQVLPLERLSQLVVTQIADDRAVSLVDRETEAGPPSGLLTRDATGPGCFHDPRSPQRRRTTRFSRSGR